MPFPSDPAKTGPWAAGTLATEVLPNGYTFKAYPKPRVPIGKYSEENGQLKFTVEKDIERRGKIYPVIANIFLPSDLVDADKAILAKLLFGPEEDEDDDQKVSEVIQADLSRLPDSKIEISKWGSRELDWSDVRLIAVPKEQREKIEAFEDALTGKWEFVRAVDKLDQEIEDPLQYKRMELGNDGTCKVYVGKTEDTAEKKFFWCDGRFERLSFQKTTDWKEYEMAEEYDIVRPNENELVLKSIPTVTGSYSLLPSRYKLKEVGKDYFKSDMVSYFKRVK